MFFLAATLAHAGLRTDLDREAQADPQLAIACSSAHGALARFRDVAAQLGGDGSPVPPELDGFLGGIEAVLAPEARLAISWWEATSALRLGFHTGLAPAELAEALARIDPDAGGRVFQGPAGWGIREADGDEIAIDIVDGFARVTHGPPPPAGPRSVPAPLLAALPDDGGCTLLAHVVNDDMGAVDVAVHLAFEPAQPASFAVALPALRDSAAVLLDGAVPPSASTPEVPEALLVLGIGLDSVDFSMFLQGRELRQARRIQNLFPLTGGTTLAVLETSPAPKIAAVLPLAGDLSARTIARRARLFARELDLPVRRVDATTLVIEAEGLEILAAAAPSRLYLSTDPGALNALQQGAGEPWITGRVAELAAEWPLVVASSVLPAAGGVPGRALPRPLLVTLDVEEGVVKGLVDLPLSLAEIAAIGKAVRAARASAEADEPAAALPPEETPDP